MPRWFQPADGDSNGLTRNREEGNRGCTWSNFGSESEMERKDEMEALIPRSNWVESALRMPDHRDLLRRMLMGPEVPPGRPEDIPVLNRNVSIAYRIFEVCVACIALLFALPIMAIIALLIKHGTPGPALFRQTRHGVNGKPFTFVKFRTLYADARQRFPELYAYKYDEEQIRTIQFKTADDPRITPQGRWLRKTSLDELPNLFLVLTGDLALVGPRPQIPEMLPYYKGIMLERYSVRPGLTDLAHVSGRSNLSFYETTAMDVAYVRAQSRLLDLKILLKTANSIIRGDGAF
jgi:lipopolysaccharide/colanic/teichoic acid biosynthesis glycosyltransferase